MKKKAFMNDFITSHEESEYFDTNFTHMGLVWAEQVKRRANDTNETIMFIHPFKAIFIIWRSGNIIHNKNKLTKKN